MFRRELLVTFLLTAFFMPFITHSLLSTGFETPYRIGLLLVACAPTGVMGMVLTRYLYRRDFHLAFSNFVFSTFGSILIVPVVLKLFLGQSAAIEIRTILTQTAGMIIVPYAAARLVNRFGRTSLQASIKKWGNVLVPFFVFVT